MAIGPAKKSWQVAPLELCTKLIDAAVAEGAELLIGAAEGVQTEPDGEIERVTGVSSVVHKLTASD